MSVKLCIGVISLCLLSGCSSTDPLRSRVVTPDPKVAIVGVVSGTNALAPLDLNRLSLDLAALISAKGGIEVTSQQVVRQIIGASPHDEMLGSIARYAQLAPYQTQRLMAANLPAPLALFARIDTDNVEFLPVIKRDIPDAAGNTITQRERQVYVTRRTTQLSASLLDVRDGRLIWRRQYRVTPETRNASNRAVGGSLGASVAAAVANSVMQGTIQPHYPEPADLQQSILTLLQEVAYNAPID